MDRRRLLYAGGAIIAGAGIADAAGGWNRIQPTVEHTLGMATLHPASDRFVVGGLGPGDDRYYHARLLTEPPREQLINEQKRNSSDTERLQDVITDFDFDTSFLLLVEARMDVEDRFSLTIQSRPRWAGWRTLSIPLYTSDHEAGSSEYRGADESICTALIEFKSDVSPESGRAVLHDDFAGGHVQRRLSF